MAVEVALRVVEETNSSRNFPPAAMAEGFSAQSFATV